MKQRDIRIYALIISVLALGSALRVYSLGAESYWLDEMFSIQVAETLSTVNSDQAHPPLYFLTLHFWMEISGQSETAVRLLSALFSSLTLLAVFKFVEELYEDTVVALTSVLVLSVSLFNIHQAQNARMYSMLVLFTVLSFLFYRRLVVDEQYQSLNVAGYLLASGLMIYTHYTGVFILAAQFFYALISLRRGWTASANVGRIVLVQAAVGILYIPEILAILDILSQSSVRPASLATQPSVKLVVATFRRFAGSWLQLFVFCVAILLVLVDADAVLSRITGDETEGPRLAEVLSVDAQSLLLLNWLGVALGGAVLMATVTTSGFQARYMITATVPLFVLVGKGVTTLNSRNVLLGFAVVTVILAAPGLVDYYTTTDNEEWREAAQYVETRTEPGDLILFNAGGPGVRGSFDFYFDGEARDRRGFPNGTREINQERLDRLPGVVDGYDRVVVVLSHSRDCNGDIARRLSEEYNLTNRSVFKNIDVYVFDKNEPTRVQIPEHPDRSATISC